MRRSAALLCVSLSVSMSGLARGQEVAVPATAETHPAGEKTRTAEETTEPSKVEVEPTAVGELPSEPTAEARKEASERFQRGLRLYGDGDYELALIEFERAYQLVPDYRGLYNIGQVAISLGRFARARVALETYLAEGKDELAAERREAVERDLEMLQGRTAHLVVRAEPPGAEVLVDDIVVGTTPLDAPLLLDAGEHRVLVRKAKFLSQTHRITLAGAEEVPLVVSLVPEEETKPVVIVRESEPGPAPLRPRAPAVDAESRGPSPALIGWTSTGLLAGGAVVTGLMGLSAVRQYDELMGGPDPLPEERDRLAAKVDDYFLAADILAATAAVAAGVSLYFTLSGGDEEKPEPARARGVELQVRSAGSSVSLFGRF